MSKSKDKDDAFATITEALRQLIARINAQLPSEPVPTGPTRPAPTHWKVPSPPNTFFTGRASILEQVHATFLTQKTGVAVQTLNGLAGIGKTQIALAYAYHYAHTYQAVFWVAADPQGDLLADFVRIAQFLALPQKDEPDQTLIVEAIKRWFQQHEGWLLLFDNVEEVAAIQAFRPTAGKGHILITTRAQATGTIAIPCEVEPLSLQEGTEFLLRRAKLLSPDVPLDQADSQDKATAQEIVRRFGGHPLALDQAGAYLEETGRSLADYLALYQQRQALLLNRRGEVSTEHTESVMSTFSLVFERVERMRPDAAALLCFCAFLHPDALPEELLLAGARSFDAAYQQLAADPYALDDTLSVLRKHSLLKRNPATKTVSVHRLVQETLVHSMEQAEQQRWAEAVVRTLGQEFPDGEPASWPVCQRYLPHARVGIHLLQTWQMRFVEATHLLNRVGHYLYKRAEYAEALGCYERALALLTEDEEPLLTARILSNLGVLHLFLAQYTEAERALKQALRLREQQGEPAHAELAQNLNDLAGVYHNQGQLTEAEPLYERALVLQVETLGAEDPVTLRTLGNLALLHYSQKHYAEAEMFNQRVLAAREKHLGATHVDTGQALLNLAYVYYRQHRYTDAEPLFKQAQAIYEEAYGQEHPQTMVALQGLAQLYNALGRYDESEPLLQQVLTRWEQAYGPDHPRIATALHAQVPIALQKGQAAVAEAMLRRALHIWQQKSWLEEIDFVSGFKEIAQAYEHQEQYERAALLHQLIMALDH